MALQQCTRYLRTLKTKRDDMINNNCSTCRDAEIMNTSFSNLEIKITDGYLHIGYDAYSCDSSFNEKIRINYCPICGKKLITTQINQP